MRLRPRSPFVLTVAASASLAACGSTSSERATNPPEVAVEETPPPALGTSRENPIVPGNPPPMVNACPPNGPPEVGQRCEGDLTCHYGSTDPCDSGWIELRCVAGTFETSPRPSCNPPPPPAATSKR